MDVSYRDVVSDADSVVRRIYAAAGFTLSSAALQAMHAWEKDYGQHKHGAHQYSLEDFGLDQAQVDAAFHDYMKRFGKYC